VRFTYRANNIRIIGAGYRRRGNVSVKKRTAKAIKQKTKYTDEALGRVKVIADFLPSPAELVFKEETVKVTLALTKSSLDFFKHEAKTHNTQYQKMIRSLVDSYAQQHQ
jgi:predicted DNA binding CopG/RHH family protein